MSRLRHLGSLVAAAALALAPLVAPAQRVTPPTAAEPPPEPPAPPPSATLQAWRTGDGWLTELRRHPDGTRSCVMAKSFADTNFGVFIVRTNSVTLFAVVDQQQPFAGPGTLRLAQGARALGAFDAQAQGPAFATVELLSRQVKAALDAVEPGPLLIDAAGRRFDADMTGIAKARAQLASCVLAIELGKPGK
ncbi:MAG: hypothetical protein U1F10_11505 [Burkholderiales bacterium]